MAIQQSVAPCAHGGFTSHSVAEIPAHHHPAHRDNVSEYERWASVVGGGGLALYGLTRESLPGLAMAAVGGSLIYRGLTGHCPVYETLGINTADRLHGPKTSVPAGRGVKVEKTIVINRSPEDLYNFWHNLENLPAVMRHLKSVAVFDDKRSHWVANAPLGMSVEWDAEIHTERPNELISWRSLPGSDVDTAGSVHFTRLPGGSSTEVHVVLKYNPPGGKLGAALAAALGEAPEQQIEQDLRQFKNLAEEENLLPRLESLDFVMEASVESFPASDAPGWIGRYVP